MQMKPKSSWQKQAPGRKLKEKPKKVCIIFELTSNHSFSGKPPVGKGKNKKPVADEDKSQTNSVVDDKNADKGDRYFHFE